MLDEPTNGLDPAGMADMRALVVDLARGGQTVLLSSHLLAEVQEICDRVGVINNGRLLRESDHGRDAWRLVAAGCRATPEPEALAVAMRLAGDDGVRRTPAGLALDLPADAAPHVIRELVLAGVDVLEIRAAERSLEEVFFEMTASRTHTRREGAHLHEHRRRTRRHRGPADRHRPQHPRRVAAPDEQWPAVWITLGAWLAMSLMFGYLFNYLSYASGDNFVLQ